MDRDWFVQRYGPQNHEDAIIVGGLTQKQADAVVNYILTIDKDGVYSVRRGLFDMI